VKIKYSDPLILSSYSKFSFHLDDADWPSAEHYYQAMKFEDDAIREEIRQASHPMDTPKLSKQHKKQIRKDWDKIKVSVMTRGTYIKCRTHKEVSSALLKTGDKKLLKTASMIITGAAGEMVEVRTPMARS